MLQDGKIEDGKIEMKHREQYFFRFLKRGSIFLLVFCLVGCGASGSDRSAERKAEEQKTEVQLESQGIVDIPNYYHKGNLFLPQANGKVIEKQEGVSLDLSHTDQGYFMVAYKGSADKLMVQVEGSDNIPYRYYFEPDGHYNALPLTAGNGNYAVSAYENVGDNRYALVFTKTVDVVLANEVLPFLYSNQYVNFNEDTKAVTLAKKLTKGKTELEAVQEVYEYVIKNIVYDEEKAETVKSGYLPNVDETLKTKKGICFDYAALMTAMLRSRDIPCKLQIGYAGDIKHAWIDVYIRGKGWVEQAITYDGEKWNRMDPTFTANSEDEELINSYIGDSANYTLQFTR